MYKPTNIRAQTNHPNLFPPSFTIIRDQPKIGRNDPCPCGSGKKYKKCCLANEDPKKFSDIRNDLSDKLAEFYKKRRVP